MLLGMKWKVWLVNLLILSSISACDKDKDEVSPDPDPEPIVKKDDDHDDDHDHEHEIEYVMTTVGGAWPDQTTYIQTVGHLENGSIDNSEATELASSGQLWSNGDYFYVSRFGAPATLYKYTIDDHGVMEEAGEIIIPGANTFSSVEFISDTEAYASVGGGLARVIKFDPSTARVTGEIDLSPVLRDGVENYFFLGMKARDKKLFMGIDYQVSYQSKWDSAYVAVIDLETASVEKVISDGRTAMIFGAGGAINSFELLENGDIYVMGDGTANAHSGILKIKQGETEFDKDYFFDLQEATGNPCKGFRIIGEEAFAMAANDPNDLWEFSGPNFNYYHVDLTDKSAHAIEGLPTSYGSNTSVMIQSEDQKSVLFAISTNDEDGIYSYDLATEEVAKIITLDGKLTGLEKIAE